MSLCGALAKGLRFNFVHFFRPPLCRSPTQQQPRRPLLLVGSGRGRCGGRRQQLQAHQHGGRRHHQGKFPALRRRRAALDRSGRRRGGRRHPHQELRGGRGGGGRPHDFPQRPDHQVEHNVHRHGEDNAGAGTGQQQEVRKTKVNSKKKNLNLLQFVLSQVCLRDRQVVNLHRQGEPGRSRGRPEVRFTFANTALSSKQTPGLSLHRPPQSHSLIVYCG